MSAREKTAVRRFARYAMDNTSLSWFHACKWGIKRMRKGLLPV